MNLHWDNNLILISDSSLNDIIYVVNPTFTKEYIAKKVNQSKMSRAYDGTLYLPGIVGLNNIKANDYCNVVLQVRKCSKSSIPICLCVSVYVHTCILACLPAFVNKYIAVKKFQSCCIVMCAHQFYNKHVFFPWTM